MDWDCGDLVSGAPLPYGSPESPFTVVVNEGEVVEITEMYLPRRVAAAGPRRTNPHPGPARQ